jgi:CRP-like cAMP-binding protein
MRSRSTTNRQTLRTLAPFRELTSKQLARVDQMLTAVEVPAGTRLTTEGATGREAFIIVSGHAAITIGGQHVATLGPGEIVGEMALLDHQPRTATVTATEPMHLLVTDPRNFNTLLTHPQILRYLLDTEIRRLRAPTTHPARHQPDAHHTRGLSRRMPSRTREGLQ